MRTMGDGAGNKLLLGLPEDWPWVICRVVDIQYMGDSEDKCL